MKNFSKMPRLSFFVAGLILSGLTQNALALPTDFADVCSGNGNLTTDQVISSVIIMGAENERRAFIEVNGTIVATKSYTTDLPSDMLLLHTAIEASVLGTPVDLCITGNTDELYGINLKES